MTNLKITGIIAVCDKYERMRLLIDSYECMNVIISSCISETDNIFLKYPYIKFVPSEDGIYGECIISLQGKHKKYWKDIIEKNRGKKIQADIKLRKWKMGSNNGISFDLKDLII